MATQHRAEIVSHGPLQRPAGPVCAYCGEPLSGQQKRFCSDRHRTAYWSERHPRLGRPQLLRLVGVAQGGVIRDRILGLMSDGSWYTVQEIAAILRCLETTASAKLRDLRKKRHGQFRIEHHSRRGMKAHEFRLVLRAH